MDRLRTSAGVAFFLFAVASVAFAKNPPRVSKSKETFEKVQSSSSLSKEDLQACIQAQDDDLAKAKKSDRPELHYRNGYCSLLTAMVSRDHADFERARKELIAASDAAKDEPAPTIEALFAIANLSDEHAARPKAKTVQDLQEAASETDCGKSGYVRKSECESVLSAAKLWLGWEALRADKLAVARKQFESLPSSPWNNWLGGMAASEEKRWPEAADTLAKAESAWEQTDQSGKSAKNLLQPKPDRGGVYARLGTAQYMAGKYAQAVPSLTIAIEAGNARDARRDDPYLVFVRARAQENLGHRAEALSDYEVAANEGSDPKHSPSEAHFYRGMLLLRRNNWKAASQELAFARNLPAGQIPAADLAAWLTLVQVRSDGCKTPVAQMEASATSASALFAKTELEDLEFDCRVEKATTLPALLALDPMMHKRYGGANSAETRKRISEAYLKEALLAEEHTEPDLAADAYRKAIEWNPQATKARFNLAGIYIEEKKFDLAEKEYRALLAADPGDHEAQYWLAESILSQEPDTFRKAEACAAIKEAVKTKDPEKKTLSTALGIMANCQK